LLRKNYERRFRLEMRTFEEEFIDARYKFEIRNNISTLRQSEKAEDWEEVVDFFENTYIDPSDYDESVWMYIDCLVKLGRIDKAEMICEYVIDVYDTDVMYAVYSICFIAKGNIGKALQKVKRAQKINPRYLYSYFLEGFIYIIQGNIYEAKKILRLVSKNIDIIPELDKGFTYESLQKCKRNYLAIRDELQKIFPSKNDTLKRLSKICSKLPLYEKAQYEEIRQKLENKLV
jgi:tetratricopeptide (TPR) repeat protein